MFSINKGKCKKKKTRAEAARKKEDIAQRPLRGAKEKEEEYIAQRTQRAQRNNKTSRRERKGRRWWIYKRTKDKHKDKKKNTRAENTEGAEKKGKNSVIM